MKIPNCQQIEAAVHVSLARIVSEDSQRSSKPSRDRSKSSKDS